MIRPLPAFAAMIAFSVVRFVSNNIINSKVLLSCPYTLTEEAGKKFFVNYKCNHVVQKKGNSELGLRAFISHHPGSLVYKNNQALVTKESLNKETAKSSESSVGISSETFSVTVALITAVKFYSNGLTAFLYPAAIFAASAIAYEVYASSVDESQKNSVEASGVNNHNEDHGV